MRKENKKIEGFCIDCRGDLQIAYDEFGRALLVVCENCAKIVYRWKQDETEETNNKTNRSE